MGHELEILPDGQASMFYIKREPPWHGLGTPVEECLTAHDALVLAGLDWEVQLFPVQARVDRLTPAGVDSKVIDVEDIFAVVRDRDDAVFGLVGSKYNPYQN